MKLTGIMPLRNGVILSYPFELALRSLRRLCDEVVVAVDPTSEDDTLARVRALGIVDNIVESPWDMSNHGGHEGRSEIARQTSIALAQASCPWVMSLQADEVLHEKDVDSLRREINRADAGGIHGIELTRLYFYGGLTRYRSDWTLPLLRLFKVGHFAADGFCGAMGFVPTGPQRIARTDACIYHYSRVGDPAIVAQRVRNLDTFYHAPEVVAAPEAVEAYDFGQLRKLDTHVIGHVAEADPGAALAPFDIDSHPEEARRLFA